MIKRFILPLLVVLLILLTTAQTSFAQDETPTATPAPTTTPTPPYWESVQFDGGNQLIIEHRITYGEIAVVIAISGLFCFLVVLAVMLLPRVYQP